MNEQDKQQKSRTNSRTQEQDKQQDKRAGQTAGNPTEKNTKEQDKQQAIRKQILFPNLSSCSCCSCCSRYRLLAPVGPDGQELPDEETDAENEEEENEATAPRVLKDPGQPSQKDIDDHAATHLPFRSWCSECVRGRKNNPAHRRASDFDAGAVPSVHLDYCFLRDGDEELLTVVVIRDKISKVVFASAVENKGSTDEKAIQQTAEFIKRLGHPKLVIKSDQENSIKDFSSAVAARLDCQLVPENSPVGESQSNGVAERAVQQVEDQLRVLKLAIERRLNVKIPCAHPAMKWLVPHSAGVITKYQRGHDGKTAFERLLGKQCREDTLEFGECILFKSNRTAEGRLAPRWEPAVWLGKRWGTTEHMVATEDGAVTHCRAVQRLPAVQRWSKDRVEAIKGTPHEPQPSERAAGEPIVLRPRPSADAEGDEAVVARAIEEAAPRGFRIAKADLERWGYTAGCPRCATTMRGKRLAPGVNHNAACRARLEEEMKQASDPRLQRMEARQSEYFARQNEGMENAAARTFSIPAAAVPPEVSEDMEIEEENAEKEEIVEENAANENLEQDTNGMLNILTECTASTLHNADMAAMAGVLLELGMSKYEVQHVVTEIYSPPRVAAAASEHSSLNIGPGMSYDMITQDGGEPWDFRKPEHRAKCRRQIAKQKPVLVVGSPPCRHSVRGVST